MDSSSKWTSEAILNLAPDQSSIKSGRGLAIVAHWVHLASSANEIAETKGLTWGLCQGSGKQPYQVVIEWHGPRYHCSCPSRKIPCKHILGLMLLYVEQKNVFLEEEPPGWVAEWQTRLQEKTRPIDPQEKSENKPILAPGKTRRAAQRDQRAAEGIAALETWIHDLVSLGLAAAHHKPDSFWEGIAVRLVDAQLPGIARRVRDLGATISKASDWQEDAVHDLVLLYLILRGYKKITSLPLEYQAELRNQVGHALRQDEMADIPGIAGVWHVLAVRTETIYAGARAQSQQLLSRRTWLFDLKSHETGLLLEFTPAHLPFRAGFAPGMTLEGEAVYFPGLLPLRLFFRGVRVISPAAQTPNEGLSPSFFTDIHEAWTSYNVKAARNPWLGPLSMTLKGVLPVIQNGAGAVSFWILDSQDHRFALPIAPTFERSWEMIAISGGEPGWVIGEWNGKAFWPLRIKIDKTWVDL